VTAGSPDATAGSRPAWRAVAVPSEHGGWSLAAEPALLGIIVAPSWAGAALAMAAIVAFLVRTPLKVVLVDRRRHRWLERSRLAARCAAVELVLLLLLAIFAASRAGGIWLAPAAVAMPLVGVELWFDLRSRSRRLAPELCGAVGIAAVAASIALAGGADARLAIGLWIVLAARSIAVIPFVRVQIDRLRHGSASVALSDRAQILGAAAAIAAVVIEPATTLGAVAVAAVVVADVVGVRRPPRPVKVLGITQLVVGLVVVAATAAGVLAWS